MKPQPAKPSLSVDEDALRSTSTTASRISRASARSSSGSQVEQGCIYNMSVCYERLRAMVPDIPARRRMSKVEILQHVIDYIQDLESALELPHLHMNNFVKDSTNNKTDRVPLSTISYNRWVVRYVVLWLISSVVSYWSTKICHFCHEITVAILKRESFSRVIYSAWRVRERKRGFNVGNYLRYGRVLIKSNIR